jgi:hypothetical protein
MYFDFEAGNKAYKLRLTTKAVMALESKIGCNPTMVFGVNKDNPRVPTVTEMVHILHNSLTHFHHGITFNDAMEIFDAWLDEGHTNTDFLAVIINIYKVSGIIPNTSEDTEDESEDTEKN